MAHFARLDENNIVTQVIVVADNNCLDSDGNESETTGAKFCSDLLGGRWIQTSFNHRIRGRYAGLGFSYNEGLDVFIAPQPNADWVLNEETYEWFPPNE
jgi:hypothetical protein